MSSPQSAVQTIFVAIVQRMLQLLSGLGVLLILFVGLSATPAAAEAPRTLFITGAAPYGYHPWKSNMKQIEKRLEAFGLDNHEKLIAKGLDDWREWNGSFEDFDLVVLIYYWAQAPEQKLESLDRYLKNGGSLVVVHSALAGFWKQEQFDRWTGIAYRENDATYGHSLVFRNTGKRIILPPGEGGGSAHAPIRTFRIHTRDSDHPIMKGLPDTWMQARDELYYNLRGPDTGVQVLATAKGPDGFFHPQAWTNTRGKGRIFCLTPGHHKPGASSVGFITLLARGIEWAATGGVTMPVPENFPDKNRPVTEIPRFKE